MDKSETYIKMSEKAWGRVKEPITIISAYPHLVHQEGEIFYFENDVYAACGDGTAIPLQRQDQLQDMIFGNMAEQYQKLSDFIASSPFPCAYFGSWEQLWLAFVMKEQFNKTWNGDDWV